MMVSENVDETISVASYIVLILVLMDDGLGGQKFQSTIYQINKAQIL